MARARKETRGDRVIAFIEGFLKVPEGRDVGKPIKLRGWQKDTIRGIYDGNRAIRRAIISIARKNGCLLYTSPSPRDS